LFRLFDYEKLSRPKIERARDDVARKDFATRVVGHDGIVVSLAREGDFVFS
jgi:hypothetical protein